MLYAVISKRPNLSVMSCLDNIVVNKFITLVLCPVKASVVCRYLLEVKPQCDVFRQQCSEQVYYLSVMSSIGNSVVCSYLLEV